MGLKEQESVQDDALQDEAVFTSRHAIDSTEEPMTEIFSMRIPHELRILGGRRARLMGLSLGEYMRYLLARDVDSDTDSLHDGPQSKALRTRR